MKNWIKMTDRAPTEADLPVWGHTERGDVCLYDREEYGFVRDGSENGFLTHWRPAKDDIPEPPKPEPTQRERDQGEFNAWWGPLCNVPHCADAWHAALAYEREQVAKMLPDPKWDGKDPNGPMRYRDLCENAVSSIRARCGGGGK